MKTDYLFLEYTILYLLDVFTQGIAVAYDRIISSITHLLSMMSGMYSGEPDFHPCLSLSFLDAVSNQSAVFSRGIPVHSIVLIHNFCCVSSSILAGALASLLRSVK